MSLPLVVAAVLLFAVGAAHSWLGERHILIRLLRRTDLPHLFGGDAFTKSTLRFAWHLTTVAWFGFAWVLLLLAAEIGTDSPSTAVLVFTPYEAPARIGDAVAATFATSAVITAVATRARHLAWLVFAAVAVLTWLAV
ncbi:MAG: hypothetical protein QY307_06855 [Acidimicrobiia bacterium]|nr:MAG: hypothetical protein QY307_06855 [Acidimicrobiia bacterium]